MPAADEPRFASATAAADENATLLGVDFPEHFERKDLVIVTRTGELIEVESVGAAVLGVRRLPPHVTTACPIRKGDELFIAGNMSDADC